MRKILITLGILVAFVIAIVASWIFAGRQISLFLDRFGTIEMTSARINSIAYEGSGTGGILHVNDLALSLNDRNVRVRTSAQRRMISLAWQTAEKFSLSVRHGQKRRTLLPCRPRATTLPSKSVGAF